MLKLNLIRRQQASIVSPKHLAPCSYRPILPAPMRLCHTVAVKSQLPSSEPTSAATTQSAPVLRGEDAAVFNFEAQKTNSWALFVTLLSSVLAALYVVWIGPGGHGLATDYLSFVESFSNSNPEATIVLILFLFAIFHSGGAALRPQAEKIIGARAYRVIFALGSLPLALVAIVYFINHRYDGANLWDLRGISGVHEMVWILNFISFFFLYPSTFNILEVAAVDEPKLHLWETGIMRITRHPQATGQAIWCAAHCLWMGNSVVLATSAALMAHHIFGCWHGDQRLRAKYGDSFEDVKSRTSIVPFAAILDGRQKLPDNYYTEFLRWPYLAVTVFTIGAYFAHPLMQSASYYLGW